LCTLFDAPQPEQTEGETLTAVEARRLLRVAAARRNGTRWSVGLALGLHQQEALGLRWQYVDGSAPETQPGQAAERAVSEERAG
jgi:hypothetical protein